MNIALFFGGKSVEHEVSLQSAKFIYQNIDREQHQVFLIGITKQNQFRHFIGSIDQIEDWENYTSDNQVTLLNSDQPAGLYHNQQLVAQFELAFPVLHGDFGEDGKIQGVFEMAGLPYVGCGVLASAVAMDKDIAKQVFKHNQVPVLDHQLVYKWQEVQDVIPQTQLPCFVKPANLGSSVGVTKAKTQDELKQALELAFQYDHKVMIEPAIEARELEVSVLGGGVDIQTATVGEIIPDREFYDYDAKYSNSQSQLLIPADLSEDEIKHLQHLAKIAFQAIDGYGLARVDFFQDKQTGEFFLNEINTLPGFTAISMYPKLWQASGLEPRELVAKLIELALRRD